MCKYTLQYYLKYLQRLNTACFYDYTSNVHWSCRRAVCPECHIWKAFPSQVDATAVVAN